MGFSLLALEASSRGSIARLKGYLYIGETGLKAVFYNYIHIIIKDIT